MNFVHNLTITPSIKDAYALISVTYPNGSTCICTKGTKVLTASDTSGSYVFPIPEAGTWTVRAYDGATWESSGHRKSTEVTIVSQYQIENVGLTYEILLYNYGDENTSVTGGWINGNKAANGGHQTKGSVNKYSDYLRFNAVGTGNENIWGSGIAMTANEISLDNFNYLRFIGYNQTNVSGGAYGGLYIFPRNATYYRANAVLSHQFSQGNIDTVVDISSVIGSYCVGIGGGATYYWGNNTDLKYLLLY